jgi:hypothetical protein
VGAGARGPELVILFTGNLDDHRSQLAKVIDPRQPFRVELADRTWLSIHASRVTVTERLLTVTRHPSVHGVGLTVRDGQYVVFVQASGDESVREELIKMAAPEPIEIGLLPPGTRIVARGT